MFLRFAASFPTSFRFALRELFMGSPDDPFSRGITPGAVTGGTGGGSGARTPDARKQAVDFAADATKQLITVAAGIVTATVIFSKDLKPSAQYLALVAWVAMTLSILCGLGVLFILTGKMRKFANQGDALDLDRQVSIGSGFQWILFLIGMVLMISFGFAAAGTKTDAETKPIPVTVTCTTPAPAAVAPARPIVIEPPPVKPHHRRKKRR